MARNTSYRRVINDIVNWNQIKANNETLFLLREVGPVGFIVQEEGYTKKYKVCLGDPHTCTCNDFKKEKDLCKHICWILLKRFRLDKDDPLSWQLGLVEREINELIFGRRDQQNTVVKTKSKLKENERQSEEETAGLIEQRRIEPNDVCPICQDDLLNSHRPVTYCRNGCGNNIHIRCMSVWTEHKRKDLDLKVNDYVPCPICRGEFVTVHTLMQEVQNCRDTRLNKKPANLIIRHHGYSCSNCHKDPIEGKLYKCSDCIFDRDHNNQLYLLCSNCFNDSSIHPEHKFEFREHSNGRWNVAPESRGIPQGLINGLQNNDISQYDYNLLLQLDKNPNQPNNLKMHDLDKCPHWSIISQSRLLKPGHQCRLCLMSFKYGDQVRQLPQCKHIFHKACIDPWLLHRTPNCPIDDTPILRLLLSASTLTSKRRTNSFMATVAKTMTATSTGCYGNEINNLQSALSISSISNSNRPNSSNGLFTTTTATTSTTTTIHNNQSALIKKHPRQLPPLNKKSTVLSNTIKNPSIYFHSLGIIPLRPNFTNNLNNNNNNNNNNMNNNINNDNNSNSDS